MIEILAWMKREFTFDLPVQVFPALLERLRGTPARARQLVAGISEDLLASRRNGKWSAKDHLGHLADLQTLDEQRLREFLQRAPVLCAAASVTVLRSTGTTAGHRSRKFSDSYALVAKNWFVSSMP